MFASLTRPHQHTLTHDRLLSCARVHEAIATITFRASGPIDAYAIVPGKAQPLFLGVFLPDTGTLERIAAAAHTTRRRYL